MRILLSIILNSSILYLIQFLLNTEKFPESVVYTGGWKVFLLGGILLGILNFVIKPILKIVGFPFVLLMSGLFSLFINSVILWLLQTTINEILMLGDITYKINGGVNFSIAVAIFSFLNMLYSLLFPKK